MKKILGLLLICAAVSSCTKDWECCITTTSSGHTGIYANQNGSTVHCIDFEGDNQEKNDYEASGTNTYNETWPEPYLIEQTTECLPD